MLSFLFPPKCVLCGKLLPRNETDMCRNCRENQPEFYATKRKIPFVAHWAAIWYYSSNVRQSIHKFKFYGVRSYSAAFGRLLAMRLTKDTAFHYDMVSWIPTTTLRRLRRGYDQSQLLANAICQELHTPLICVLRRTRNTPPQSLLGDASQRRANVLGAFKPVHPENYIGKRVLLVDDVVTTGATASECAKTLLMAGAAEVHLVALAATSHDKSSR